MRALTVSTPSSPRPIVESTSAPPCRHGLRPGTTVCLRCRQEERIAARNLMLQKGARFGMLAIAGGIGLIVLVLGLAAVVKDARSRSVAAAGETALPATPKNTKTRARTQPALRS